MRIIKRKYLQELVDSIGTPEIKVITGVEQSGKTTVLKMFENYVKENIKEANIISISLYDYWGRIKREELSDFIEERYKKDKKNFVLIDWLRWSEDEFKIINKLKKAGKCDIYVAGSSYFIENIFKQEFEGKIHEIEVFPFSFKEYMEYYNYKDVDDAFSKYLVDGGLAGSYMYDSKEEKNKYYKDTIKELMWEIVHVNGLVRRNLMTVVTNHLMENLSEKTSYRKIADTYYNYYSTNHNIVSKIIKSLCSARLFYKIGRYDIKKKRPIAYDEKYYVSDYPLKYVRLEKEDENYGLECENIVAIELLRRGYDVYSGVLGSDEIDFVAIKENEKLYIQVTEYLDQDILEKEAESLLKIKDAYPKIIIARTRKDTYQCEGIQIYDIARWLNN